MLIKGILCASTYLLVYTSSSFFLSLPLNHIQGFPLTDASLGGTSFAVVSGHDVEGTDWGAFSQVPTLVILMAGRALPAIVDKLLTSTRRPAGFSGVAADSDRIQLSTAEDALLHLRHRAERGLDTPVVVVKSAGLPDQRVWRSTLGKVVTDTYGQELSPCVVVVGNASASVSSQ